MAHDHTRNVHVVVLGKERYDGEWMPENLTEAIRWLSAYAERIPAEHRASATIEITSESGYEGSHNPAIEISYERPPTAEEIASRRAATEERLRRNVALAQRQKEEAERRLAELSRG